MFLECLYPRASGSCGKIMRAGTPTAVQPAGTFEITTAFAPIFASSPISTSPKIQAPAPINTFLPIFGFALTPLRPPIVTF